MAKLLGIETLLMILTGLYTATVLPLLLGHPVEWPLFTVGVLMALAFVGLYALANLGGQKMPARVRLLFGVASYVVAFWGDLVLVVSNYVRGVDVPNYLYFFSLAPALAGLLLSGVAALRPQNQVRGEAAAWAVYIYAFSMLGVRYLLVPLVEVNLMARLIAVQSGAFYLLLRGLVRILMPTSAEGNADAAPLIHRPVPDRIVGLVEGTTRRPARPFATRPDGSRDEGAISLLCRPEDLPGVTAKVEEALQGTPFVVQTGMETEGRVEIVIRPAPAVESAQD